MIDDDYLFLYLSEFLTNREFVNISFVSKRFAEPFILAQLNKRLTCSIRASINNIGFFLKERKGREMKFIGTLYIGSLDESCLYNILMNASLSIQINAPLWIYKTNEHSVFGIERADYADFDVLCSDTEFATISLRYFVDENQDVFVNAIEFMQMISVSEYCRNRRHASILIVSLIISFLSLVVLNRIFWSIYGCMGMGCIIWFICKCFVTNINLYTSLFMSL